MNIPEMVSNCFQSSPQGIHQPPYTDIVGTIPDGCGGVGVVNSTGGEDIQLSSLLGNISMLKEKVNQVQSLATIFVSSGCYQGQPALASMGTVVQEIIVTASSMMFNCQQMALGYSPHSNNIDSNNNNDHSSNNTTTTTSDDHHQHQHVITGDRLSQLSVVEDGGGSNHSPFTYGENFYNWYNTDNTLCNNTNNNYLSAKADSCGATTTTIATATTNTIILEGIPSQKRPRKNAPTSYNNSNSSLPAGKVHPELGYDIVELDAADLLAKYTHYCQICGKGFKRDANLRMHMRAHGDEYKTSAALSNPLKHINNNEDDKGEGSSISKPPRKYSCPEEGCRWNKNHAKFQPLKSMICLKNHYKRSHCPKLYVCKRCNRKQFSVLSDLRTHEKHCGDLKWQCSCGTTFSRKDKLMGHVTLFVGHTPIINPTSSSYKIDSQQGSQIQF